MERLTEKLGNNWYGLRESLWFQGTNKLGQLEDLEQELGIGLVELFGLVGKRIYWVSTDIFDYEIKSVAIQKENIVINFYNPLSNSICGTTLNVYGQFYFTRAEAEKKLEEKNKCQYI